jgi:hypothetical protein
MKPQGGSCCKSVRVWIDRRIGRLEALTIVVAREDVNRRDKGLDVDRLTSRKQPCLQNNNSTFPELHNNGRIRAVDVEIRHISSAGLWNLSGDLMKIGLALNLIRSASRLRFT